MQKEKEKEKEKESERDSERESEKESKNLLQNKKILKPSCMFNSNTHFVNNMNGSSYDANSSGIRFKNPNLEGKRKALHTFNSLNKLTLVKGTARRLQCLRGHERQTRPKLISPRVVFQPNSGLHRKTISFNQKSITQF